MSNGWPQWQADSSTFAKMKGYAAAAIQSGQAGPFGSTRSDQQNVDNNNKQLLVDTIAMVKEAGPQ